MPGVVATTRPGCLNLKHRRCVRVHATPACGSVNLGTHFRALLCPELRPQLSLEVFERNDQTRMTKALFRRDLLRDFA